MTHNQSRPHWPFVLLNCRPGSLLCCLFLCFLSLNTFSAVANNFYTSAHRITAREGLPQTTIFSIAKDQKGFLWFGTSTSLMRFDGYEFREFSKEATDDRALAVSGAGNIYIDSKNRLWVGSWGEGVVLYDDKMNLLHHFVHKRNTPGTLGSNKVQVVYEDSRGDIWIGTNGSGLSLYQPKEKTFINYAHHPQKAYSISHNRIWAITETEPGVLWVATSNGLNRLDTNVINRAQAQFIHYQPDSTDHTSLNHALVRSIYADKKGRLWVGTQIDFGRFDGEKGTFEKVDLPSSAGVNIVTRIREDNDGNILIATLHGLFHYRADEAKLTPWAGNNKFQLFPQNDIRDVMVDKNNLLWVTTRFAGLIKIDLRPSSINMSNKYVADKAIHPIDKIYSILPDSRAKLWASSVSGLLYKTLDSDIFEKVTLDSQLSGKNITTMVEDHDGLIWLGGHFGLYTLNTKTRPLTFTNRNEILDNITTKNVQALLVDSQNNLWIGTAHEGLVKFDQHGELSYFVHDENKPVSLSGNTIMSLLEDNTGQIWVGTAGAGINRLDLNHQRFYQYQYDPTNPNSISDNKINDIYQTQDSVMWFATPKSLDKLDYISGNFVHYNRASGLANSNIRAIIEDDFSDLWLSTSNGISQFNRNAQTFLNYTNEAETGNNHFLPGVVAKNKAGKLLFGGITGINEVIPSQIELGSALPTTVITNVWVDNRRLASYDYPEDKPLELDYDTKSIQLQFASLDFHQSSENKYRYILEGHDEQWRNSQTVRTAGYASLKPGKYLFKVEGNNGHNQWSDKPASLTIIISPPWWEIIWVRVLLLSLLLIAAYLLSLYRLNRVAMKEQQLEQQVNKRTCELDESNKALASTINRLNESQNELVEKEKMASLGQMVAGIAHEVNTPIGLGITASTLLTRRMEDIKELFDAKQLKPAQFSKFLEEGLQNTGIIFRNLERAANLINGFKQVAVDQSSEQDRHFKVTQILDEILLSLSPNFHDINHRVTVNCPDDIEIFSKPGPFTQVIINLVMNSIKHAFTDIDQGVMTIDVSADENNITLIYRDNGIGVNQEFQKIIYDPFVTTRRGSGSTGLGMHLVYNIVTQALGGSIHLQSELNDGVEFTIVLPRDVRER